MKKVLLVVDVQNYFAVDKAKDIPKKIASYIEHSENEYHAVLFAKFYNDPSSNFHTLLDFTEATASPATDIHEALQPFVKEDTVFVKKRIRHLSQRNCVSTLMSMTYKLLIYVELVMMHAYLLRHLKRLI